MANRLVLEFYDSNRGTITMTYNHAEESEDIRTADVRALVNAIITNGSIFQSVPVSAKSAKLVMTSESEFQLSA